MKKIFAILTFCLIGILSNAQPSNHFYNWYQFSDSVYVVEWQYNDPPTQTLYYPVRIVDYTQVHIAAQELYLDSVPATTGAPDNFLWRSSSGEVRKSTSPPAIDDVGDMELVAYTSPPTGWLACDGAAVSRSTYAALFARVGTSHGSGDGSTTFNVPNITAPSGCAYIIKY